MGIKDKIEGFLWSIALKKGAQAGAKAFMAWIASLPLEQYGVSVSFEEAAFMATATFLFETARNWAKQRFRTESS